MWTRRNGSCVSSVIYFCFMVLQTCVKTTTTTYHKVPTSESDLFVFLDFSLWTCPGRSYGVLLRPLPLCGSGRGLATFHRLLVSSLTLIAALLPSISSSTHSRKNLIPPLLFVLVVSQTLSVKLGLEFCENSSACSACQPFQSPPSQLLCFYSFFLALWLLWSAPQTPFLSV